MRWSRRKEISICKIEAGRVKCVDEPAKLDGFSDESAGNIGDSRS